MFASSLFFRLCCTRASDSARDLTNKVVVVTGGAEGIGYDIAKKFLAKGANITILLDNNEKLGAEAAEKLTSEFGSDKAIFMKCDVTTDMEPVCKDILDSCKVDVLVNSAGILDEVVPKKVIDINVTGTVEFALKFWHYMRTDKGGHGGTIINLSSIYGYRVDPFFPVYKSTKYADMGFTKSLGHPMNFERTGVRVVAICPGFTETTMTREPILWDPGFKDEFLKYVKCQLWQKVGAVGDAAVEVFQNAESGTAWVIEGNKPIESV